MTKQEEIDTISKLIAKLPADSYIKPWLSEVFGEMAADIRSDVMIVPTIKRTRESSNLLIEAAKLEARDIIAKAQGEAEKIRESAEYWQDRARQHLREAERALA